jgi:hypothetical protein
LIGVLFASAGFHDKDNRLEQGRSGNEQTRSLRPREARGCSLAKKVVAKTLGRTRISLFW